MRGAAPEKRIAIRLVRGAGSAASGIAGAIIVAAGVPLAWVWIASQVAGENRELTPSIAILITAGILVSYWVVLLIGSWVRSHLVDEEVRRAQVRRMSWNRSFRDEPHSKQGGDPVERIFVLIAVIAIIAFEIWFFFFAGSPLPNQPLF
jgi:MFS family permease